METKICLNCYQEKSINEFFTIIKRKSTLCVLCQNNSDLLRLNKRKAVNLQQYNYLKKFPWKRTLANIKQRCNNPKCEHYDCYGGRGIKCLITEEELKTLWYRDKAFEMKKPSIDRINNNGNYEFNNCQFLELPENFVKDKRKPILQFDKKMNFIKEWNSIKEASNNLKISLSGISGCAKNKIGYKTAGSFIWKFKEVL